jgi:hypothetical protein
VGNGFQGWVRRSNMKFVCLWRTRVGLHRVPSERLVELPAPGVEPVVTL